MVHPSTILPVAKLWYGLPRFRSCLATFLLYISGVVTCLPLGVPGVPSCTALWQVATKLAMVHIQNIVNVLTKQVEALN